MKSLKSNKKKLLIALGIIIALSAAVSIAFTVMGWSFYHHKGFYPTWAEIRELGEKYGYPIKAVLMLTVSFSSVITIGIIRRFHDIGNDILGRKILHKQDYQPYGDSHFESESEYDAETVISPIEKAEGTILGRLDNTTTNRIVSIDMSYTRMNWHTIVFGASGSGKTYTYAKNYMYQCAKRQDSIIMSDPDGGLYRDMAAYFWNKGYEVRRFDMNTLSKSDGWDCLNSLRAEGLNSPISSVAQAALAQTETGTQMFARTIIVNSTKDTDSIYATAGMSLLTSLLLYVVLSDEYNGARTITSAYQLLKHPDGEKYLDALFGAAELSVNTKSAADAYRNFKTASDKLRGNIMTNVSTYLQLLGLHAVQQVLTTNDIDLVRPGLRPTAIFCIFPDSHDTFKFLITLFFSSMFTAQINYADHMPDGKLPVRVNYLLDEFPSLGVFPAWKSKMATVRKRNIHITMICQDITQLRANYPEDWVTIMQNCATMVVLGANDLETAGYISQRIGETTVEVKTEQHAIARGVFSSASTSYSTGAGRVSLLSPDQIMKLTSDRALIIFQRHNPILVYTVPHTLNPESTQTVQIPWDAIPDISDTEGRKKWREMEQSRIYAWELTHPEVAAARQREEIQRLEEAKKQRDLWESWIQCADIYSPAEAKLSDSGSTVSMDSSRPLFFRHKETDPVSAASTHTIATVEALSGDEFLFEDIDSDAADSPVTQAPAMPTTSPKPKPAYTFRSLPD